VWRSGPGFLLGSPVLGELFTLVTAVILARVGGRLLGIRLRWRRAILAGFAGLVVGWIAAWSINGQRHGPQRLSWPVVLVGALVATMLIAVLLELLARPGRLAAVESRVHASPLPHPIRSLRQRAGRSRRYLQVTRIAARHGLSCYLGGRRPGADAPGALARNLRVALEEAGGMFVKLGQVLSTRADLLPPDVIAELSRLQDHVAPADPASIEALLIAELGAPRRVFASFDAAPVAAASIGQAHRARLATGELVIVKVQRPQVRALVERDLDILLRMARALEARAGWARQFAVLAMTRGFAAALREELDFRIEARNIAAVASSSRVRVPAVHQQWSTSRVLVMEYLDGIAVRDAEPVLAKTNADRHGLARGLLAAMLGQVMLEGTFHADPHPGNVLVLRDGQLGLIDFGSAGRLDPLQQAALRRLLLAVARRHPAELHDALLDLAQAARPQAAGEDLLEPALAQFLAQHLGPGMVPGAAMFTALFRLLHESGLVFPPVIAAVFRAMITLDGTLARLAPGFQIIEETQTIAASWLGEVLSPASLRDAAADEALGLLPVLRRLPRRIDRITTALERGTLTTSVRLLADDRDRHFIRTMAGRAVLAFLGAAFGIISVMLIGVRGGPLLVPIAAGTGGTSLFHVFGYVGLFFSLVLTLRVVIAITREGI
jgi:ubiquinone biosynthesis protein